MGLTREVCPPKVHIPGPSPNLWPLIFFLFFTTTTSMLALTTGYDRQPIALLD